MILYKTPPSVQQRYKGKQAPWILRRDSLQAQTEGWDVFQGDSGRLSIQALDISSRFRTDSDALVYVMQRAIDGSDLHARALLHIDRFNARHHVYEIIVGNVGTVYVGTHKTKATTLFAAYVKQSGSNCGRAAGESVVLMRDDEPLREYTGKEDKNCVSLPPCAIARTNPMFELREGWLFYGRDGKLYVAQFDVTWPGWEVFEAHIEWWASVYNEED